MKTFILSLITVFLITSSIVGQEREKIKLKGVRFQNDYHEKTSWIKSKPTPLVLKDFSVSAYSVKYIQIYFGMKDEGEKVTILPLRIVNAYKDNDWVFFDEISYLLGSRKDIRMGKGVRFKISDSDTSRDVYNGVSEYSDISINSEIEAFIRYVIENPETGLSIRYLNTRNNTYRELRVPKGTKQLKKNFQHLIDAYNRVNEGYKTGNKF